MAIAPLQIPGYAQPQSLDLATPLAQLGQTYRDAQARQVRQQALSQLGQGGQADVNALIQSGDMSLANLGLQLQQRQQAETRDARDFAFRQEEAKRAQANADRSFGLQQRAANRADEQASIPSGFERAPTGGLRPVAGGPQDPAYIERATQGKVKPRQMSVGDVAKLSEEGGKLQEVTGFVETFKDDFSGRPVLGDARNWVGRTLPTGVVDQSAADGSAWWQGYDRYKNQVRNELFGSALTAPEKAAFEKADVNPGMNPDIVRKNLKVQQSIVRRAIERKSTALENEGYRPETIRRAYGLDQGTAPASIPVTPTQRARNSEGKELWLIEGKWVPAMGGK